MTIHWGLQILKPRGLRFEDAEHVLWSQSSGWGFHHHPPLYTWLVQLGFWAFGTHIPVVLGVRYAVLGCYYAFLYGCSQEVIRDRRLAVLTAFLPLLIPILAENSLWTYSHSLLGTALLLATCFALLKIQRTGGTVWYLVLGLVLGLGTLSKYNYLLYGGCLLLAAMSRASFRLRLLEPRILWTLVLAGLLVCPHLLWGWEHRVLLLDYFTRKGLVGNAPGLPEKVLLAATSLGAVLPIAFGPLLAVWWFCLRYQADKVQNAPERLSDRGMWLGTFLLLAPTVLLFASLLGGPVSFREPWLLPYTALAPLFLGQWSEGCPPTNRSLAWLRRFLVVAAALGFFYRVGEFCWPNVDASSTPAAFASWSRHVSDFESDGFQGGLLVADTAILAGNLRICYPHVPCWCVQCPTIRPREGGDGAACLVVWDANSQDALPEDLRRFLLEKLHRVIPEHIRPHFSEVTLGSTTRTNRIGYVLLPLADAGPRGESPISIP